MKKATHLGFDFLILKNSLLEAMPFQNLQLPQQGGGQSSRLRLQRLMVILGTQMLVFCFFIRIITVCSQYSRAEFHGFSVVCPVHPFCHNKLQYFFDGMILQSSRFVKIKGIVAEMPVCITQNNSYEPSSHMDLVKYHGEFFVWFWFSKAVRSTPTQQTKQ